MLLIISALCHHEPPQLFRSCCRYAGAISDQVKVGKPVSVELCGEKLVLFRKSDGKVGSAVL